METFPRGWALSAFRDGVEAARKGKPLTSNPYRAGSDPAALWDSGWAEGRTLYTQ